MSPRAGLWLALLVPLSAAADPAGDETLLACRAIDAASERLACYDRVVDRVRAEIAPEAPPAAARAPESPAPPATGAARGDETLRERLFGRSVVENAETLRRSYGLEEADSLTARVASARSGPDRLLEITLDNGQVWKQAEQATFLLKAGDRVDIASGALGAYYLRRNEQGRSIRVKRLR